MRRRIATVLAVIVAFLGATSTTASAAGIPDRPRADFELDYAQQHPWTSPDKDCFYVPYGVEACVQPHGDVLWLKDLNYDGNSVRLRWEDLDGDRYGLCVGNKGVDAGWQRCNKNLPENHRIEWYATYYDHDDVYRHTDKRTTRV